MKKIFDILLVQKPRLIPVIFIIVIFFGIISLYKLPIEYIMQNKTDFLSIVIKASNLKPEYIEYNICAPLESSLRKVKEIEDIYAYIKRGELKINLELSPDSSKSFVYNRVSSICSKAFNDFPDNVSRPVILTYDTDDMPVLILNIDEENKEADYIEKEYSSVLSRVEGVSRVEVLGTYKKTYQVRLDKERMSVLNINLSIISDVLRKFNIKTGFKSEEEFIRITGAFDSKEDILNTPVHNLNGKAYYFKDFSDVVEFEEKGDSFSSINGKQALIAYVFRESSQNVVSLCNRLKKTTDKIPEISVLYDQGSYVVESIVSLLKAVGMGALISAVFIFFLFKDIKLFFPVILGIPLNFLLTFIFMYLNDISVNIMSMAAILFSLGLLYDNSVIFIENLMLESDKYSKELDLRKVFRVAIRVSSPLFISLVTTLSVFIPVFFIKKDLFLLYRDFVMVIVFSLSGSFIISSVLIPYFFYILKVKSKSKKKYAKYEFINTNLIAKALIHRKKIIYISLFLIVISIFLYGKIGSTDISDTPENVFILMFQPGIKISYDKFLEDMDKIENIFKEYEEIEKVLSTYSKENARLIIRVKKEKLNSMIKKYDEIMNRIKKFPDIFVYLVNAPSESFKSLDINIFSEDFSKRIKYAQEIADIMYKKYRKNIGQIVIKEKTPMDEVEVIPDRNKLIRLGMTVKEFAYILRAYLEGPDINEYFDNEHDLKIKMKEVEDVNALKELVIRKDNSFKVKDVARINIVKNPASINHQGGSSYIRIGIFYKDIDIIGMKENIEKILDKYSEKRDIKYMFDKKTYNALMNREYMGKAIIYTGIILCLVLYMYYNNIKSVLLVFSVIPVTYSVIIIIMYFTGLFWSIPVYISFILLSGIVVNNSIFIIHNIEKGKGNFMFFRIVDSINSKYRAVLITTGTTVMGLIPLLWADSFWKIMGIISITGLITATVISVYLLPALLYTVYKRD